MTPSDIPEAESLPPNPDDVDALKLAQSPIQLPPQIPEWLTPLVGILPAQLFACHLTSVKGYDTEKPRSITKVTETH